MDCAVVCCTRYFVGANEFVAMFIVCVSELVSVSVYLFVVVQLVFSFQLFSFYENYVIPFNSNSSRLKINPNRRRSLCLVSIWQNPCFHSSKGQANFIHFMPNGNSFISSIPTSAKHWNAIHFQPIGWCNTKTNMISLVSTTHRLANSIWNESTERNPLATESNTKLHFTRNRKNASTNLTC